MARSLSHCAIHTILYVFLCVSYKRFRNENQGKKIGQVKIKIDWIQTNRIQELHRLGIFFLSKFYKSKIWIIYWVFFCKYNPYLIDLIDWLIDIRFGFWFSTFSTVRSREKNTLSTQVIWWLFGKLSRLSLDGHIKRKLETSFLKEKKSFESFALTIPLTSQFKPKNF